MKAGDRVEDFEATTDRAERVRLSDFTDRGPVVLFFYPKAFTPGCTAQSCHFRDLAGEFEAVGASVLGISADEVDTQSRFAEHHGFKFPLLSDVGGKVAKTFGVKRPLLPLHRRTTFVIDRDRTVIEVISSETNMEIHADRALEVLRERTETEPEGL